MKLPHSQCYCWESWWHSSHFLYMSCWFSLKDFWILSLLLGSHIYQYHMKVFWGLNKIIGRNLFNHWLIFIGKLILVMIIKLMIIMFLIVTRHHESSFFHMFASNTTHTLMSNYEQHWGQWVSIEISLLILKIISPFISTVCRKQI